MLHLPKPHQIIPIVKMENLTNNTITQISTVSNKEDFEALTLDVKTASPLLFSKFLSLY
jgi:hypothetical protein